MEFKLCGGVFFTLFLQALKPRIKTHNSWHQENDGLDDISVLDGLIRIIDSQSGNLKQSYKGSIKSVVSRYKFCEISRSSYLPFDDQSKIDVFSCQIIKNWNKCLSEFAEFMDGKIEINTPSKKDIRLVAALIDLIKLDDSIDCNEKFFISGDGSPVKKSELITQSDFNFYSFILGIWYYIVVNKRDNTVGKDTIDYLHSLSDKRKGKHSRKLGEDLIASIQLTYSIDKSMKTEHAESSPESGSTIEAQTTEDDIPKKKMPKTCNIFNDCSIGQYIEKAESVVNISYAR